MNTNEAAHAISDRTKVTNITVCLKKKSLKNIRTTALSVVFALILVLSLSSMAAAQAPSDKWQFSITPYLWIPDIDGTLSYDVPSRSGGAPTVSVGADSYLENLDLGLMLNGDAKKGRWAIYTDVIYLDFSNTASKVESIDFGNAKIPISPSIDAGTETSLRAAAWTLTGGYGVLQGDRGRLEVMAGFRYLHVKASSDWRLAFAVDGPLGGRSFSRSGSVTQRTDLWDGIIGFRGRVNLGNSKFYIPYYFDIGTGSSNITYQGLAGLGYGFKWFDLVLVYRHLFYDMDEGKLIQDTRFSGPALGITFRF
jgi:hypothetical protein